MMDGMDKDSYFKCPNCGEELCVETSKEEKGEGEDMGKKPAPKMNAGTMPMHDLKSKISSGPTLSNLNSY